MLLESFENWQEHRLVAAGASDPLAEIVVKASDLPGDGIIYSATNGVIGHGGVVEQPSIDRQVLIQTADEVEYTDLYILREQRLSSLKNGRVSGIEPVSVLSRAAGNYRGLIIMLVVLISFIVVLTAGLIIAIVVYIRYDKKAI